MRSLLASLLLFTICAWSVGAEKPNVILIMTDDQGYGDVAAHGNTMIKTPHMDQLYAESVRLTDYHVDPTCSPTRSALMSGRYSTRTGVWHTIMGRSLMAPTELTLGEVFTANGYRTGMFGKWHLGDNAPLRPQDQGFQETTHHGGGGVGQTPDYWGNDYFDDTYWRGEQTVAFNGYCTDVWFGEALKFIDKNKEKPFFCYLATNAPHGPYLVAEKYSEPYIKMGVPETMARFYGMITNIDENLGKLRAKLAEWNLDDNTILIFTTDNGTAAGVARRRKKDNDRWTGFNAGMRGQKGSEYEGGHRVPFFIHWPAGKLTGGRDVDQLSAHIDVLPTLVDLCELNKPDGPPIDGQSLKAALYGDEKAFRDRTLFVHSQRIEHPEKWRKCSVMTERWRLVNGKELYDIQADPGQQKDLAEKETEVVARLREAYEKWWSSLKPVFDDYVYIGLGGEKNPTRLTAHDWHTNNKACPWHQGMIQRGLEANGPWRVDVAQAGDYEISLYRWPRHLNKAADCVQARLKIGSREKTMKMKSGDPRATFRLSLKPGQTTLQTWLTREDDKESGAYFVWVRRIE